MVLRREPKFWDDYPLLIETNCSRSKNYIFQDSKIDPKSYDFLETPAGRSYKKILAWNHAYPAGFAVGYGFDPFEKMCCKEKRCFLSPRKNPLNPQDFDAILFHHKNVKLHDLPRKRTKHQRWILFDKEPPSISGQTPEKFDGIFNWTMTYRKDADVIARYGYIYPRDVLNSEIDLSDFEDMIIPPKNKKLVAWVVSHCQTASKREKFVKLLQKYIEVDIRGKCGTGECDISSCFAELERTYKFYLAFENSLCTDYITEKFYRTLKLSMVPIVLGHADHEYVAPPHSYIDASKFDSAKSLADYLLYLDKNDTAYLEYFSWKKDFVVLGGFRMIYFCNLCRKLHMDNQESSSYNHLRDWWVGKSNCTSLF